MRGLAAGVGKTGGGVLLVVFVLRHVRPHLERQAVRADLLCVPAPMSPTHLGGVIGTPEPSLIPAKNLVPQRSGVDLGLLLWEGLLASLTSKSHHHHDSQDRTHDRNNVLGPSQPFTDALRQSLIENHVFTHGGHWDFVTGVSSRPLPHSCCSKTPGTATGRRRS